MNKKFVYGIAAAIAVSTASVFAADEVAEKSIEERLAALESSSTKSSWADNIKFKGDLRYRYEQVSVDDNTNKNRQRIRARIGAYAEVNDFTTAGLRIRTGQDANSGNQTIGDHFDGKEIFFDLAYMAFALNEGHCGDLTLGKMKYPWKVTTDLIWDGDVNPEGIAYNYATNLEDTGLFGHAGYYKVEESSSTHDLNLAAFQAGMTKPVSDSMKATAGASLFLYDNAEDFVNPDTAPANYTTDYSIVELFAEVGCKDLLSVPVKFYGNYVNNVDEGDDSQGYCAGIKFADAKKGKWEAKLGVRRLEADAAPSYFADSDFAGGGSDIKGLRLKAKYNMAKNLQAGLTVISGEQISSNTDVNTLHLDLIASF